MSTMHPAAVEHLRKRWTRPDAYRFAPPGSPEARPPWERVETASADAVLSAAEQDAFEHELLHLRWLVKSMRLELALRRFQEKYSPDQPRVPAGSGRESGRWTDSGGSGAGRDGGNETARTDLADIIRICMAGSSSITTDRWGNQKHWVDYVCADGFTFRNYGLGGRFKAFLPDPRF